jgi:hypothetical protein
LIGFKSEITITVSQGWNKSPYKPQETFIYDGFMGIENNGFFGKISL